MTRLKQYALDKYRSVCRSANPDLTELNKIESVLDHKTKSEIINQVFNSEEL